MFLSQITEGTQLKWGDRCAFGFRRNDRDGLDVFIGLPTEPGFNPVGDIRAMLFWPYLFPDASFITSTGKSIIYVATGITDDEWKLAKATTSQHVLLLLCRAGVGQRTDAMRHSVLIDPQWKEEWQHIASLDGKQAYEELGAYCPA